MIGLSHFNIKVDFYFYRNIIVGNVRILAKYLSIFDEQHLLYILTTFVFENEAKGANFRIKVLVSMDQQAEVAAF